MVLTNTYNLYSCLYIYLIIHIHLYIVLALSSNAVPSTGPADLVEFKAGLRQMCSELAEDIVRNGEGTQHVIKASVCVYAVCLLITCVL